MLDLVPGAVVAWSVRRLSSSYTGPIVRIRNTATLIDADFGAVGEDLDTAAVAAFLGANPGLFVKRYDQTGNGADEVQGSLFNRFFYVDPGGGAKPYMAGDGVTGQYMVAVLASGVTDVGVYTVARIDSDPSALWQIPGGLNAHGGWTLFAGTEFLRRDDSPFGTQDDATNAAEALGVTRQRSHLIRDGGADAYSGGVLLASSSAFILLPADTAVVAGSWGPITYPLDGRLYETVIYPDGAGADRLAIEANQAAYFGTPN